MDTDTTQQPDWHNMAVSDVLSSLEADKEGLDSHEAKRRLQEHGSNKLQTAKRQRAWQRFLRQFNNVLIYVLLLAAGLTALLGEWVDTLVILAVVFVNAVIGFIQEGKAEQAMESIRGMLSPKAKVVRDGQQRELSAEELVPGDIVVVNSGDRVPADIRILETRNAQVDESNLTGESEPVNKQVDPVDRGAPLGDRSSMAYSSTMVTTGQLRGIVTATGEKSEIGKIGSMVSGIKKISTPLLRKIDAFGKKLSLAIVFLSAALFLFGYFVRGFGVGETLIAVVSLAVAAIPEGLPAIMTITLALGVQRMARRNAIVRRLPAVETLGSVTVIFSDKTGTLTRNEMTVAKVVLPDKQYEVSGAGYTPEGGFRLGEETISPQQDSALMELARAGLLSSDAHLKQQDEQWKLEGMPTEGAAVVLALKAGLNREQEQKNFPRVDVIPFESERRYMATLHRQSDGTHIAYIKGAPERILEMCTVQRGGPEDEPIDRDGWMRRQEKLADAGHRVLAFAEKQFQHADSLAEDKLADFTLLGFIGIIDPPRQEVIEAIEKCHTAGITVKMVTGDHALTARSIGKSIGIGDGKHVITGNDLDQISDKELIQTIDQNDVFARSSPGHKLRMIESVQSAGQIVAMTGDGVNDAPALKRANIGIAMGIKGSEASKEAAEIVLADDNFATIERAVEEGRTIYDNLIKTILFMLPTNGAESLIIIAALVLLDVLPITPLQILWVNMVTAVTLALALAFEPPEEGIMKRPPRQADEPIISGYLIWRIVFVSCMIAAVSILHFMYRRQTGASLEQAGTVAVNTLVAGQIFYLFNSRYLASALNLRGLVENRAALIAVAVLILLQLAFTYFPPLQNLFHTAPVTLVEWAWITAAGAAVFFFVEVEKKILHRN